MSVRTVVDVGAPDAAPVRNSSAPVVRFFDNYQLTCTPLSPIHIGCGEDYEPTGYLGDRERLWAFDPTQLMLTERERSELTGLLCGELSAIAGRLADFYRANAEQIRRIATHSVALNAAAKPGAEIARTSYALHSQRAYLPGSSLKGSLRTALLDFLYANRDHTPQGRSADDLERDLHRGKFAEEPLRLLKVADSTGTAETGIYGQVNRYKKSNKASKAALASLVETILPMQSASFQVDLQIQRNPSSLRPLAKGSLVPSLDPPTTAQIAGVCNRFSWREFQRETSEPRIQPIISRTWMSAMSAIAQLINVENSPTFLLRVGRHCGAESLTIEGVRQIKIISTRTNESEAHTVWLAADTPNQLEGLLPFGWLLCEFGAADSELRTIVEECGRQLRATPAAAVPVAASRAASAAASTPARAMIVVAPADARLSTNPQTDAGRKTFQLKADFEAAAGKGRRLDRKRDQGVWQRIDNAITAAPRWTAEERLYLGVVLRQFGPTVFDVAAWQAMLPKVPPAD